MVRGKYSLDLFIIEVLKCTFFIILTLWNSSLIYCISQKACKMATLPTGVEEYILLEHHKEILLLDYSSLTHFVIKKQT